MVRDAYASRLLNATTAESRSSGVKLPASPADMMLRIVNQIVDGYLELRRELTRQLDHWQSELLRPGTRFTNWSSVLDARLAMHQLDEICEDQRSAVQDWIDSVETWPEGGTPAAVRERELLKVRSRDVLEHIERVVPRAPHGAKRRDRRADAFFGAKQPHQRHHAHAHGADRHLPAAEPDHRLLRHEFRRAAADPQRHPACG